MVYLQDKDATQPLRLVAVSSRMFTLEVYPGGVGHKCAIFSGNNFGQLLVGVLWWTKPFNVFCLC